MKTHPAALFSALLLATSLTANNWNTFRGPTGMGDAEGEIPAKWSDKSVQWSVQLPGTGQSSPVNWGNKLFLTTASGEGAVRSVLCLDKDSGKTIWKKDIPCGTPEGVHKMNSHATPSCATDGKCVVAFFGVAGLHCFAAEDGKTLWSRTDLGNFQGDWGIAGSPIFHGDNIIQNCDSTGPSYLLAVNKDTGKTIWKTNRETKPKGGWSTPILIDTCNRKEIVLNGEFGVKGYNAETGEELWFCKSFNGRGSPIPYYAHGLVYTVNGKPGDIYVVKPGGKGDVTNTHMAWHAKRKGGRDLPSPAVIGEQVLVTAMNGTTCAYEAKTGELTWAERLDGAFSGSPLIANGLYYIQNEAGTTYVVKPGKELQVVSTNSLPAAQGEIFRATLVPIDGKLYIRSSTTLYCVKGS
jgi:outer membrane protein assembly factor BamB